jgi:hypothetical protein
VIRKNRKGRIWKVKKIVLVAIGIVVLLMALSGGAVLAGDNNQNTPENGKSVERGTGRTTEVNEGAGYDGCQALGGDYPVYIPPEDIIWLGGPCCPSNILNGEGVPYPNECCNPPDFIHAQPGNHCLCFAIRGFTTPA